MNVVVLNSFSHVFESDTVVKPLCPLANLVGGCFCLGSGPFCVSGLLFFALTKRKSGWGICGSSCCLFGFCCLICCDLPALLDLLGPCTNVVLTAYAHVRTEPQCDIGQTRGKKSSHSSTARCASDPVCGGTIRAAGVLVPKGMHYRAMWQRALLQGP